MSQRFPLRALHGHPALGYARTVRTRTGQIISLTGRGARLYWQPLGAGSFYEVMAAWLDSFENVDAFYRAQEVRERFSDPLLPAAYLTGTHVWQAVIRARIAVHRSGGLSLSSLFERFSEEPGTSEHRPVHLTLVPTTDVRTKGCCVGPTCTLFTAPACALCCVV